MLQLLQARPAGVSGSAVFWILVAIIAVAAIWWFTTAGNRGRVGAGGPGAEPERNRERNQGGNRDNQGQ